MNKVTDMYRMFEECNLPGLLNYLRIFPSEINSTLLKCLI